MVGIQRVPEAQDKAESENRQVGGISHGTPTPVRGGMRRLEPSFVESCAPEGETRRLPAARVHFEMRIFP